MQTSSETAPRTGIKAPPTRFADIVTLIASLPPLPPVPDDFRTALLADVRLGGNRELLVWLGQAQRRFPPQLNVREGGTTHAGFALYAGPHADAAAGWESWLAGWHAGASPTAQALAGQPQVELELYELLGAPIADSRHGPALTETQAAHAMAYGMLAAKPDLDLLALSTVADAESGAETSALAVISALTKREPANLTADAAQAGDIEARLIVNRPALTDPLTIMATLGGHESAAILGALLAARLAGIPALLEGLPALAAALTLARLAGTSQAAQDLLGHARATHLPDALQSAFGTTMGVLPNGLATGPAGPAGEGQRAAAALPQLRTLARG